MSAPPAHLLWFNWFRPQPGITEEIAALWSATPLFRDIPRREVRRLSSAMQPRQYRPGEAVFDVGDLGAGAVLILSGDVSIRAGDRQLARLARGDFFGEVALVRHERRTARAVAAAPAELVFLMQAELTEWIERSPRMGARVALNLAAVLADRLRHANRLLSIGQGDAESADAPPG